MFKTFYAVLAAACAIMLVLTLVGVPIFVRPFPIMGMVAVFVLAAWCVAHGRHAAMLLLGVGVAMSLSACGTLGLGGLPTSTAGQQQLLDNIDKINAAAAQHCTGGAHLAWNPPFPPTGSLNLDCVIGQQQQQLSPDLVAALAKAGFVQAPAATANAKP